MSIHQGVLREITAPQHTLAQKAGLWQGAEIHFSQNYPIRTSEFCSLVGGRGLAHTCAPWANSPSHAGEAPRMRQSPLTSPRNRESGAAPHPSGHANQVKHRNTPKKVARLERARSGVTRALAPTKWLHHLRRKKQGQATTFCNSASPAQHRLFSKSQLTGVYRVAQPDPTYRSCNSGPDGV